MYVNGAVSKELGKILYYHNPRKLGQYSPKTNSPPVFFFQYRLFFLTKNGNVIFRDIL